MYAHDPGCLRWPCTSHDVEAMDASLEADSLESEIEFAELQRDPHFTLTVERIWEIQAKTPARLPETFRRDGLAWPPPE